MNGIGRWLGALVAIVAIGAGVFFLRDATISRHTPQDPDSRLEVVLDADIKRAETGQTKEEYVWAKLLTCRTEVIRADPVGDLEPIRSEDEGEPAFRVVLQPSLDDTDRKQFRGCIEDWNLDHVMVDVVSMTELAPAPAGSG